MSKRKLTAGIASVCLPISVADTSSTTGGGLSGLVFNTANLVAEYRRQGQAAWTAITLVAGTLGTWISGGFVADGALSGDYELCVPNACLVAGARWVIVRLRGAANMLPVRIEIEIDAVDYQDAVAFGLSRIDLAISSRGTSTYAGGAVASVTGAVASVTGNVGGNVVGTVAGVTPAAAGAAMTLTSGERNSIAAALLDLTDGVETAVTLRQAQRLLMAVLAGKAAEASGVVTFKRADGTTTALTVTHGTDGTRSVVTIGTL